MDDEGATAIVRQWTGSSFGTMSRISLLWPTGVDTSDLLCGAGVILVSALRDLDHETGLHLVRVSRLAGQLASVLGLPPDIRRRAATAGLLHDIGKSLVPRRVLLKPGMLDPPEIDLLRLHPVYGQALASAIGDAVVLDAIRHHHERLDGAGYPDGLSADQVAVVTRIVTVADVYDALTSNRPYRPALSTAEACLRVTAVAGSQLDPEIVQALVRLKAGVLSPAA
jgi:HD-GYP domain-containing protein (c-di-GMP phosphodiesterase class II)